MGRRLAILCVIAFFGHYDKRLQVILLSFILLTTLLVTVLLLSRFGVLQIVTHHTGQLNRDALTELAVFPIEHFLYFCYVGGCAALRQNNSVDCALNWKLPSRGVSYCWGR